MAHLNRAVVGEAGEADVRHGKVLPSFEGDGPWAVTGSDGGLLAVYEPYRPGLAKPAVVLAPDS